MVGNEIQFLSWEEFKQMAPSILQLEITRLGALIDASEDATDFRNALVKARYELKQFIACLPQTEKTQIAAICASHLQVALLNVTLANTSRDAATTDTLQYVIDRLTYVLERIQWIY
ncbi:MAG: hypothetical protein ACE5G0_04165 [Rhodothermales bacterium]